jgi:hypothetical protein
MPQVDTRTVMTIIIFTSNSFLVGYILFNIYILGPSVNLFKADNKLRLFSLVEIRNARNNLAKMEILPLAILLFIKNKIKYV